jgi:catechol 2,3-dioxygenase-like lactoylglutathione lyase family enzyme
MGDDQSLGRRRAGSGEVGILTGEADREHCHVVLLIIAGHVRKEADDESCRPCARLGWVRSSGMATTDQLVERYGLGSMDQISFAVGDADEAATRYQSIFGKFDVVDVPSMDVTYRGQPSTVTFKLGFGRAGPLEVELVQVVEGDSPVRDHFERFGEGFNHVRYRVPDLEASRDAMEQDGWVTVYAGETGDISFCFLEPPVGLVATIIELIQGLPID